MTFLSNPKALNALNQGKMSLMAHCSVSENTPFWPDVSTVA